MNLFTSQQAPAILALILSVIGYYVSTVVGEIRAQPVVTYEFILGEDGDADLHLKIVSLAQVVQDARFEITCTDGHSSCLAKMASGEFAHLHRKPPVSPTNVQVTATATEAQLTANLVPGAVVALSVKQAAEARGEPLEFFYTASKTDPAPLLLFEANSLTAMFVDSYFDLMLVAFLVAAFALFLMIVLPPVLALRSRPVPTEEASQD